ncbi:1-deoxy-D-xylulose-5-phosphate reductoisomerase [Clostridium sp. MSJ-11]|uniref:1-deoxy-D-xylulose 5-phosphate reductoisomerase n=1 Tax=Clostridium mobile TaxID=2841512 RepID=A0ABS6EC53_9CLOT|nr:1-deoxy-D-xylulose-5-phosphate reductoisomerase [Clostridium mobile]MBU5482778.1 1-deoxy-D-xylulose-5-phosphate reductoisomerase [Clostridium mobile]
MKRLTILGATGSVGTQALDVIRKTREELSLVGISAHSNWESTIQIIEEFNPKYVAMTEKNAFEKIMNYCKENNKKIEVLWDIEGLNIISSLPEIDIVLTSVVGMIGLQPTLNAIKAGKDIALANKETLVVGGQIIINEVKKNNVKILPVDSEHSAIFQCLEGNSKEEVDKIILTASGGPFRGKKIDDLENVTLEQALKHPRWNMGKKISIDSATLMNKGLEVIEAHYLFGIDYKDIQVVIHPQSIIHSMVQYEDGSVISQMGTTDMRLPIQYALNYPKRRKAVGEKLDFYNLEKLTFEKPDLNTFKPLKLAYTAGEKGGIMPTILNAANEAAVDLFLNKKIKFLEIGNILEEAMNKFYSCEALSIESIIEMDKRVKNYVFDSFKL